MITGFWWYLVYGVMGIDTAKENGIAISDFKIWRVYLRYATELHSSVFY